MNFVTGWAIISIIFVFGYFLGMLDGRMYRKETTKKQNRKWKYLGEAVGNIKTIKFKDIKAHYDITVNYIVWRSGNRFKINHSNDADTVGTLPSELSESSDAEVFEFLLENYTPVVNKKNNGKSP